MIVHAVFWIQKVQPIFGATSSTMDQSGRSFFLINEYNRTEVPSTPVHVISAKTEPVYPWLHGNVRSRHPLEKLNIANS